MLQERLKRGDEEQGPTVDKLDMAIRPQHGPELAKLRRAAICGWVQSPVAAVFIAKKQ